MSPTTALQSPVFLFYLALATGLLVLGGGVLAVLRGPLRKNVEHAWAAYRGWLFIVPLLFVVFFLGRESCIVFVTVVSLLGFREFARATGLHHEGSVPWVVYLGIGVTGVACLLPDPTADRPGWYGLFAALPVFVVAALVAIPVVRNRTQDQLRVMALASFGFVYFGWMLGHLAFLANSVHAYSYLGYLVLAVEVNDVAAYLCGKALGRHPLRSNISPRKTWEGAAGALAVSCFLPWVLLFPLPHFAARDCIVVGLLVGIGGQLGDLVVSVIKRDLGIKDMGTAIPGHGGVLDRIDSLVFVAPLFFHYLRFRFDF